MNDFTKEEWEEILNGVGWLEEVGGWSEELDALMKKIRSMIDNYCEHEWVNATYCEKCNKGIWNE